MYDDPEMLAVAEAHVGPGRAPVSRAIYPVPVGHVPPAHVSPVPTQIS